MIGPADDLVTLTVMHDGFEPGSGVFESVRVGWPKVISSLKPMLETGTAVALA